MGHSPLLLQLVIILATARALGLVLRYFGQSAVIGEMAAGIVLGPVVFGALLPELHAQVFEKSSLGALGSLSQVGLVLFMFIVGAELRLPAGARKEITAASWIGVLSVLVPMALGMLVGASLHDRLAPAGVGFWPFALFMAAALSITAFPVMARILKDRQHDADHDRPPVADERRGRGRARVGDAGSGRGARGQRARLGSVRPHGRRAGCAEPRAVRHRQAAARSTGCALRSRRTA